ncbi:MAG: ribosome silencing factor [Sphingobacteriaceae bacterium]|nr:ribosome silencing factor [Sphingobacteriaceae bacterium]MBK7818030.1 ribosome silencing factor [Sphingobacteriaceae bacterium]
MAKKKAKPVKKAAKKAAPKKAPRKKVTSLAKGKAKKPVAKRSTSSKGKKVLVKTKASDKEKDEKKANAIVNSEKKKIAKKRVKVTTSKETNGLLDSIIDGMQERKAKNITVLDLQNIENRIADFFVICDADSGTHVNAIADSVEEIVLKKTGERPYHSEGQQNGEWILIDYINIVAHVFLKETREYYNIEGLWGDAEIRTIN